MSPSDKSARISDFSQNHLQWVALHHFLPSNLLGELCAAIVSEASSQTLSIGDLFESLETNGPSALTAWAVRPRSKEGKLAEFLQRFVKSMIWQSDATPGVFQDDADPDELIQMKQLEFACGLGAIDLSRDIMVARAVESAPTELHSFVLAMQLTASAHQTGTTSATEVENAIGREASEPLRAVALKHMGDLSADLGDWALSDSLYSLSEAIINECTDSAWREFLQSLKDSILLSKASGAAQTKGPAAAAQVLAPIAAREVPLDRLTLVANGVVDATSAVQAAGEARRFGPDTRVALSVAPQIAGRLSLSLAFEYWADQRFNDAHRAFWAVLRRQIALGSLGKAQSTKAYYGRCIIDSLSTTVHKQRDESSFLMAVRLLIESGSAAVTDGTEWKEPVVQAYVDDQIIRAAVAHFNQFPGTQRERHLVAAPLFKRWTIALDSGAREIASAMLQFLARTAKEFEWSLFSDENVRGACFDALKLSAQERPEFRHLVDDELTEAVITAVADHFGGATSALESALQYLDALRHDSLRKIASATLSLLEDPGLNITNWPLVRAAMDVLTSEPVRLACSSDRALDKRLTSAVVRVSSEQETEHTRLLWILSDLTPDLAKMEIGEEKLATIVRDVRGRALRVNASNAINNVMALLMAPWASGEPGILDALEALKLMLVSGATGKPCTSFPQAYNGLLLLLSRADAIADASGLSSNAFRNAIEEYFSLLKEVWRQAKNDPLIFNDFSIPRRTEPNATLVHNWTFTSIRVAGYLGETSEMNEVLEDAATVPALAATMALAKGIARKPDNFHPFDIDAVRNEGKEAFYGALGQRLVWIADLPSDKRGEQMEVLLNRCLLLGPDALDAAIFVGSVEASIRLSLEFAPAKEYQMRLKGKRSLRLSLLPLFERLVS